MKEVFAIIAALVAVGGNIPYLRDAYKKRVTPHPYTWLVWTLVTGITLFGQIAKGAGIGALPTAVSLFFTVGIFLYSIRNGFKDVVRSDKYYLVIALLGLIPWAITKDPTISVIIAVGIDLVAFVPTIRKTWVRPTSETPVLYSANVIKHILTLLSLGSYNIATMLHSIAMIVTNTIMTSIILLKKTKQRQQDKVK